MTEDARGDGILTLDDLVDVEVDLRVDPLPTRWSCHRCEYAGAASAAAPDGSWRGTGH